MDQAKAATPADLMRERAGNPARPAGESQAPLADSQTTERMLNALVRHAPMGWACIDRTCRYVQVNARFAALNGRAEGDYIGRTLHDITPRSAEALEGWVKQVFATGLPVAQREVIEPAPSGEHALHLLIDFYPIHADDGTVSLVGATVLDISDYRHQAQALRRGEAEFRAIFEHSGVPKAVAEFGTGRLIRVNPRYCQLTGYSADELSQMTFRDLTHPEDRARDSQGYQDVVMGRREWYESQHRCIRRDGTVIWVFVNARLVRDVLGMPQSTVAVVQDITARKAAEEALRHSEQRLRIAQRAAELCIWEWNLSSGRTEWSSEVYELLRMDRSAPPLTWESFKARIHPDDAAQFNQRIAAVLEQGEHLQDEFRILAADGSVRWLASFALVQRDGSGRARKLTGASMDVTERKRTELAARDSAERLTLALEASQLGDWQWSTEDDLVRLSPRGNALFGLAPGDVLTWAQLQQRLHPDDRELARRAVQQAVAEGNEYDMEYRILLSGQQRWIAARGRAQYDASGRCTGMRGVVQDVTERRQAEQKLRETAERLVIAQRAARAGAWEWDLHTRTGQWSAELYHLFGINPAQVQPTMDAFFGCIVAEDRGRIERELAEMIRDQRRDVRLEFRIDHPRQGVRWILSRGRMIIEQGQPVRMSGISMDMTERKQAEEQLREAKEEAEKARRQAEDASQAKDHFLAQLSHELRTPLTPVLMTAQAMEQDPALPEALRPDVEMIKRNVELEARLIDDLLDLTRIARGKIELHREVCDVHGLLEHALRTCLDEPAQRKQLKIRTQLGAAANHAWADPARLQQVFWNIIKNAIKFTGAGGTITLRSSNPAPNLIRIEIADSGIGIEPQALEGIFAAFEQGGVNVTRRFGGLGLGLAICRALVDLHGGAIRARSAGTGAGATFTVDLPALVESETPSDSAEPRAAPVAAAERRPLRVLLVEDHESTARVLQRLLAGERYAIQTATSVRAALALARSETFDLLVSDLGLPDGSGLQLMAELRQLHPTVRGIAVSGYGMEEDLQRSAAAGFDRHLVKPVNFQTLREVIDEVTRS